jgi:prepilin-type N-terminal cleavage/methylation domain-containing protein
MDDRARLDPPPRHRPGLTDRGFTLPELLVACAVIAIIMAASLPVFLTYWRTSALTGGAQELRTILNQARQLARAQNTTVCVNQSANKVQFLTGGCAGTVWTGPGTDGNGWLTLQNNILVSAATANVVFNYIGAATTAGTYTVQNPVDNSTLTVTVALSGRITIP